MPPRNHTKAGIQLQCIFLKLLIISCYHMHSRSDFPLWRHYGILPLSVSIIRSLTFRPRDTAYQ